MSNVSNNLWGNPNREVTNASDVTRRRAMKTVYNNVKQHTNHVITNDLDRTKNNHTYGIGYSVDETGVSSAILTSRSYEDKYMISKARFCCISNNNIDYLKKESYNGNKLVVKYKRPDDSYSQQILYTGNLHSQGSRHKLYDMIPDYSTSSHSQGEGYFVKANYDNWVDDIADLSHNESNSFKNQAKLNPLNNQDFTIKGPIILD
tara:strand:- start:1718 stop:2332 length:615 start_codon:yes stop_codon:yes gene_type:complete